jgi:hypothetical protein
MLDAQNVGLCQESPLRFLASSVAGVQIVEASVVALDSAEAAAAERAL